MHQATETYGHDLSVPAHQHLICWRSVLAGLSVSLLTFVGLLGLGLAFGGIGLDQDTTASGAGIFAGTWVMLSAIIACTVGGYTSVRTARFRIDSIGAAQGAVVAALFVLICLTQTANLLGFMGEMTGKAAAVAATGAGAGIAAASQNPGMQMAMEDLLGDTNIKNDPQGTIAGVTTRLVQGNTEGAKTFFARQAGITKAEADAKIAQAQAKIDELKKQTREAAAATMKTTGWSVFLFCFVSALFAAIGGWMATVYNINVPFMHTEQHGYRKQTTTAL